MRHISYSKPISRGAIAAMLAVLTFAAAAQAGPPQPTEPGRVQPGLGKNTQGAQPTPKPLLLWQKKPNAKPSSGGAGAQIIGGTPASFGEFPYFVSVQSSAGSLGDAFCGGSLMSTTKVLTAARCVATIPNPADLQVTIGANTLIPNNGVVRNISAIAHGGWNPVTQQNDVAILTLATPIVRTDTMAQWLRLARAAEFNPVGNATVIGHGNASNQLLKAVVPLRTDAEMSTAYGASFDPGTMMGAGLPSGPPGFCDRDAGGPLVITSSQHVQVGDASWGGCPVFTAPGVYGELYQGGLASWVNGQVLRPTNDQFASAFTLTGPGGSVVGSNENATTEPGEPGEPGVPAGETTVWYSWTPSVSGTAQVTVNQHGFDSEVSIFTGSTVSALTPAAFNDDENGSLQSEVEFFANAGTTYRIRVDGYAFDYGPFRLSYGINRPVNDDFASSQLLLGTTGLILANTSSATGQAGEPAQGTGWADATIWYVFVPSVSGTAHFTTAGSGYDTTLAAYTGNTLAGLSILAFNDDDGTLQSTIFFGVTVNQAYRIQVGGFNGNRGSVRLQYS